MSSTFKLAIVIIAANLAINIGALFGYNAMRQHAMAAGKEDRALIQHKLDRAEQMRDVRTARIIEACRR